ncbi:unnamed protein product [Rotaria sp. Silwood2]|nr:unnamed protein product [Rotaria sp. Silwood2]CAF4609575.1 unnamed protein product [Rotaria sp. Silwood2]
MDGGSGLVDIDSHKATILVDLQDELRKIPTQQTNSEFSLAYNTAMKVANRRCYPKCFECGSYDSKYKYHVCKCGHKFCFICLKTEEECKRDFKSAYNQPCGAVAQQTFHIFPRLCHEQ